MIKLDLPFDKYKWNMIISSSILPTRNKCVGIRNVIRWEWYKGPSINYVFSKSAIFDPSPALSSFLLSKVYLLNRLWDYPPPYRDDIVYGRLLIWNLFSGNQPAIFSRMIFSLEFFPPLNSFLYCTWSVRVGGRSQTMLIRFCQLLTTCLDICDGFPLLL